MWCIGFQEVADRTTTGNVVYGVAFGTVDAINTVISPRMAQCFSGFSFLWLVTAEVAIAFKQNFALFSCELKNSASFLRGCTVITIHLVKYPSLSA